ncbi:peptidyl-prolyl cis-trans isomerase FKBP13, chloroplastic [Andrographis paniculata]|uniref:peptidyl-prolyl cis-trans isomerase FKBP13, chloroplastic n=1 Tax=Andrographis paniculata TaxID=175694 RepID=UPI0021E8F351|nr:peptidyl-prolyl cis-trans isomerase FKBP13, chloroplastic [Andrographis paniculata]
MNSLAFAVRTSNPAPGLGLPIPAEKKHQILGSCRAPKFNGESNKSTPAALNRREALGVGVGVSLLQLLNPRMDSTAAAVSDANSTCEYTVAPSGLAYCDKVVGAGPEAVKGQLIKAHYVGRLEDGKVFDSSYNRGQPLTFRVGVGEVIKGWDEGIIGGEGVPAMLTGGKRKLRIPPQLGYGMRGAGCRGGSCIIPPDSVLLFDVEFVGKAAGG